VVTLIVKGRDRNGTQAGTLSTGLSDEANVENQCERPEKYTVVFVLLALTGSFH